MTVIHYGGSWFYIDELAPKNEKNSYELTLEEWTLLQSMDVPSIKTVMMIKQRANGIIKSNG